MNNQGFIKSSALTGSQKAAILLAEIGPLLNNRYEDLFAALHLTPKEMRKLSNAMKSLQPYLKSEPKNIREIYREQDVLEAALRYGEARGIYNPNVNAKVVPEYVKNDKTGFGKIISENPDAVARIIGNWLDN